jgi:hypothetical protein
MVDNVKYIAVNLPRTMAVISVNVRSGVLRVIECSNRDFCVNFRIAIGDCPHYCQVIVEAKNYLFRREKTKAEIYEIFVYDKLLDAR